MAVLVEAISVIVRKDSVTKKIKGGEDHFRTLIPNATYCDDGELARVGFMSPEETKAFVDKLTEAGLTFLEDDQCVDIAVCDQQRGLTRDCDWLEFGRLPVDGGKVAAAWLFEGPRIGHGLHMPRGGLRLHMPGGWKFEGSLSDEHYFLPNDATMH